MGHQAQDDVNTHKHQTALGGMKENENFQDFVFS